MVNMARKGSSVAGGSRRVRRLRVLRVAELEQARAITVQLGNRQRGRVECNQTALWYTAAQKQCDKAVERFEQSVAVDEQPGGRSKQAMTRANIGGCLSRRGQHDRARLSQA